MVGQIQNQSKANQTESSYARNIVEKIWESHVVNQLEGHPAVFAIDLMLLHEVTSAQAFQLLRRKVCR